MQLNHKILLGGIGTLACFLLFQNCGMAGFTPLPQSTSSSELGTGNSGVAGGGLAPGGTLAGTPVGTTEPPMPSGTGISALLKWDLPAATTATQFIIDASTDGVNFQQLAAVAGSARSYKASGLSKGATYTFRIRSQNSIASSESVVSSIQIPAQ